MRAHCLTSFKNVQKQQKNKLGGALGLRFAVMGEGSVCAHPGTVPTSVATKQIVPAAWRRNTTRPKGKKYADNMVPPWGLSTPRAPKEHFSEIIKM